MPTKKKDEDSQAAATGAAETPEPKPEKAAPKYVVYQKRTGSYTIAGVNFPPFTAVAAPAALADRIEGSVDASVMRVYADEDKAKAAVKLLKAKLMPTSGEDAA